MRRFARYLSADSPLGPGLAGVLTVVAFAFACALLAPPVVRLLALWWGLWLP